MSQLMLKSVPSLNYVNGYFLSFARTMTTLAQYKWEIYSKKNNLCYRVWNITLKIEKSIISSLFIWHLLFRLKIVENVGYHNRINICHCIGGIPISKKGSEAKRKTTSSSTKLEKGCCIFSPISCFSPC